MIMGIGIITITIAALVAIITFGQWQTSRRNLKLALFEKRYEVYESITGFIANIGITGKVKPGSDIEFLRETKRAHFLFAGDESIKELISKIYEKAVNLAALDSALSGLSGTTRTENMKKQREIKEWLQNELKNMETRFEKYLILVH